MAQNERLRKHLNYLYLNVRLNAFPGTETWARVGKSTEWTDTMNVQTTIFDYIEDSSPTEIIEHYQPVTSMPLRAYEGDPIYEYVFELYRNQEVGGAAHSRMLRVFQSRTDNGERFKAQRCDCTVTIDNFNFATGVVTFNIKQNGSPRMGGAAILEDLDTQGNLILRPEFTPD